MKNINQEILIIGAGNVARICADMTSKDVEIVIVPQTEPTKPEVIRYELPMQCYAIEKSGKEKRRERRKKNKK